MNDSNMENDDKLGKREPTKSVTNINAANGKRYVGQESGIGGINFPKSYYKQHLQTIDEYIQNKSDYEIYEQLTVDKNTLFDVSKESLLIFFQLLYQQIYFVESNKNRPLLVVENLQSLSFTDEQLNFLYEKILNHFADEKKTDEQIDICCREIAKLQKTLNIPIKRIPGNAPNPPIYYPREKSIEEKNLDDYLDSELNLEIYEDLAEGENKGVFDNPIKFFQLLEKQLNFIIANISKPDTIIKTLRQLPLTENQQHFLFYSLNKYFGTIDKSESNEQLRICKKLIEKDFNKLNEKLFPERKSESSTTNQSELPNAVIIQSVQNQRTQPKEREGINKERAFLFFDYLFTFVNAVENKTKRNQVIERLTGYKIGQLSKLPSWFEKEKLENEEKTEINEKFLKDMNEVSKLFISLGLSEIAEKIERDLEGNIN